MKPYLYRSHVTEKVYVDSLPAGAQCYRWRNRAGYLLIVCPFGVQVGAAARARIRQRYPTLRFDQDR